MASTPTAPTETRDSAALHDIVARMRQRVDRPDVPHKTKMHDALLSLRKAMNCGAFAEARYDELLYMMERYDRERPQTFTGEDGLTYDARQTSGVTFYRVCSWLHRNTDSFNVSEGHSGEGRGTESTRANILELARVFELGASGPNDPAGGGDVKSNDSTTPDPPTETQWSQEMSKSELAKALGLSLSTLRRRIKAGKIEIRKITTKRIKVPLTILPENERKRWA